MKYKMNINNIDEKLIIYLMILNPFIDLFNGFIGYVLRINISPGVIIRSIITVSIILIYTFKKKGNIINVSFIIILFLTQMLFVSFNENINLYEELSFISKIYYNMFLLFVVGKIFVEKKINYDFYVNKLILVNIIVIVSLIITKLLGLGVSSYGESEGYKGLYIGLNDLTAMLIITFPFILYKLITTNKKLIYSIYSTISAINIIMLGTKTAIAILMIIVIFFIFQIVFKGKKISNIIIIIIAMILFSIIFKRYFWDTYSSTILVRLKYFIDKQDFATFIVSGRNMTLVKAMSFWSENLFSILFGLGFTNGSHFIGSFLLAHGMIEMDLFDILYFYGVIIFLIIAVPLIKMLFKSIKVLLNSNDLLYKIIALVYILSFIVSFLGGHILLSPLSGIYFIIIYGMIKGI